MARVGIVGYMHEANALARPITRAHGLDTSATPGGLTEVWEAGGAIHRLRELRGDTVDVVEFPVWEFGAAGLLDGDDFRTLLGETVAAIRDAVERGGPLDAVVVAGHGAGRTTDDLDPDATYLRAIREAIGPDAVLVVVLDFHANVSAAMCAACDVVVGYRTNPHVDVVDRLREAGDHVHRMLDGARTSVVMASAPIVLPQIGQNTTPGETLGIVVDLGQRLAVPPVRNVSVFGGFSLADVPTCGLSVTVTVDEGHETVGRSVAAEVLRTAWSLRPEYRVGVTSLDAAVARATRAARGDGAAVILADTADNPGGGAPGNTTFVLAALHRAGVTGVVSGLHCDPGVVRAAFAAGVGGRFTARFNADSTDPLATPFTCDAVVLHLAEGTLHPTRGVYAGSTRHPGPTCGLEVLDDAGRPLGLRVGVSSHRVQCADDDTLRHAGLDPAQAKVVVVKSRGHFRAGFDHLFTGEQIVEVGAPGVATNDLHGIDWRHLPRPVFPLDHIDHWEPAPFVARLAGAR